jgi:CHAD domain-containing protein
LVVQHCAKLRETEGHINSKIYIYVERNLGFEAEHHKRALGNVIPNCQFYLDEQHDRVGILTTNDVKHAMAQLTVLMLEENRLHIRKPHIVSNDPRGNIQRLREQMEVYSYQYKSAQNTFQKDAVALSGKVGGMKDDICICLQLACYFTQLEKQREQVVSKRSKLN